MNAGDTGAIHWNPDSITKPDRHAHATRPCDGPTRRYPAVPTCHRHIPSFICADKKRRVHFLHSLQLLLELLHGASGVKTSSLAQTPPEVCSFFSWVVVAVTSKICFAPLLIDSFRSRGMDSCSMCNLAQARKLTPLHGILYFCSGISTAG